MQLVGKPEPVRKPLDKRARRRKISENYTVVLVSLYILPIRARSYCSLFKSILAMCVIPELSSLLQITDALPSLIISFCFGWRISTLIVNATRGLPNLHWCISFMTMALAQASLLSHLHRTESVLTLSPAGDIRLSLLAVDLPRVPHACLPARRHALRRLGNHPAGCYHYNHVQRHSR